MVKVVTTVENRKGLDDSAHMREFNSEECASGWVVEQLLQFIDRKDLHKCYGDSPYKVRLVKDNGVIITFWLIT